MDNTNKIERIDSIKGALVGFCVGDAMGAVTEFMTPGEIREKYGKVTELLPGGWIKDRIAGECTDDTSMLLAVCNSLVASNGIPDYKDMAGRLLIWLGSNPKDVGVACRRGLEAYRKTGSLRNGDDDSLGNGGLLRCLGFALSNRTWQEAFEHVCLTHNTSLQARAVQSYVLAIQAGLAGGSKRDMLAEIRGIGIRRWGVTNNKGNVKDTFSSALNWFNTSNSFEECIIAAVNAGGDADSVAAIAGSMAGCLYGCSAIPERWTRILDPKVSNELIQLTNSLNSSKLKNT